MDGKYRVTGKMSLNSILDDRSISARNEQFTFKILPDSLNSDGDYCFELEIKAESVSSARENAQELLSTIINIVVVSLKSTVTNWKIDNIQNLNPTPGLVEVEPVRLVIRASTVTARAQPAEAEVAELNRRLEAGFEEFSQAQMLAFKYYAAARASKETHEIFWSYYQVLTLLVGDRPNIEQRVCEIEPEITMFDNVSATHGGRFSIVTAIRDAFNHPNSYPQLETNDETLAQGNRFLYRICNKVIENEFGG